MDQHMRALERANEVRKARAELKKAIKAGPLSVADILAPGSTLPAEIRKMTLADLLSSQRLWGAATARRFLAEVEIRENRQVGDLTSRQRRVLVEALGESSQLAAV